MSKATVRDSAYSLEVGRRDGERLALVNRYLNPGSERLLRAAGLAPGMRVLDVGCGQGQMAHFVAREVGPTGQVVGVDASAAQLEIAAASCPHPERTRWLRCVADDLAAAGAGFDLVYCRLLLMHVGDPVAVLKEMGRVLRPGGLLVVETALVSSLRIVPARPDADLWQGWWFAMGDAIGASYRFPEQAPIALRALGFTLEHLESYQPTSFDRDAKLVHVLGFEQVVPSYLEHGGATPEGIERQRRAFQAGLDDEDAYVELYRMLQIRARKPA